MKPAILLLISLVLLLGCSRHVGSISIKQDGAATIYIFHEITPEDLIQYQLIEDHSTGRSAFVTFKLANQGLIKTNEVNDPKVEKTYISGELVAIKINGSKYIAGK